MQQKPKRSWSIRTRSSIPAFASEPVSAEPQPVKPQVITPSEPNILKTCKDLLSESDSLRFVTGASKSDPRILEIRKQIEIHLPKLYKLSDQPSPLTQDICRATGYAEAFLRAFSDFDLDKFRSLHIQNDSTNNSLHQSSNSHSQSDGQKSLGSSNTSTYSSEHAGIEDSIIKLEINGTIEQCCPKQQAMLTATHKLMLRYTNGKQSFEWQKAPPGLPPDEIHTLLKNQINRNSFHSGHYTQPSMHTTSHPNVISYSIYPSYDGIVASHRR